MRQCQSRAPAVISAATYCFDFFGNSSFSPAQIGDSNRKQISVLPRAGLVLDPAIPAPERSGGCRAEFGEPQIHRCVAQNAPLALADLGQGSAFFFTPFFVICHLFDEALQADRIHKSMPYCDVLVVNHKLRPRPDLERDQMEYVGKQVDHQYL
jgi:hypothetical protein